MRGLDLELGSNELSSVIYRRVSKNVERVVVNYHFCTVLFENTVFWGYGAGILQLEHILESMAPTAFNVNSQSQVGLFVFLAYREKLLSCSV